MSAAAANSAFPHGRKEVIAVFLVTPWLVAAALAVATPATPAGAQPVTGLTAAAQLARVYDVILDARFGEVPALLEESCPPAPGEACLLLEAVSTWWQIQLDPRNKAHDDLFRMQVESAITAADGWTMREPERAEAWFYLGAAYGARVQWRVLRGEKLAAARDGKRIKDALERALTLDPSMHDAYFGIGLYHYYADVAPAALKVLRWLLALPGGDREQGLAEMQRARTEGQLLRGEADYQLHVVYLWYEERPELALDLLEALRERHPRNPHFVQAIAEVEAAYLHDANASLRTYEGLLTAARAGRVEEPLLAQTAAQLGIARNLDALFETDRAVQVLDDIVEARPAQPAGAVTEARELLRRARARLAAPAYRLSLEGWRALERGDLAAAERALSRSLAIDPDDPLTQYRQARLLLAQHDDEGALVVLAGIHKRHEQTPPTIYTLACIDAARVHEQQGAIDVAIDLYRSATTVFGGDRRMKEEARQHAARLSAVAR